MSNATDPCYGCHTDEASGHVVSINTTPDSHPAVTNLNVSWDFHFCTQCARDMVEHFASLFGPPRRR